MIAPIGVPADIVPREGPRRRGSELRWQVEYQGRPAVLAQLAAELARDPAIRERWIDDTRRMVALDVPGHCRPVRTGPDVHEADVHEAGAPPPWRLRPRPDGVGLDAFFAARAPLPVSEAVSLVLAVARCVAAIHREGAIIRDLVPRNVVLGAEGVTLVDIGLSRTDVLSSRTAASLLVEDSPYTAPELLRKGGVDRRADVYSLGVIAHVALTGLAPWGDRGAVLRPPEQPPDVRTLRPEIPAELAALVAACLAEDPAARPGGADVLGDALEGRTVALDTGSRVVCQGCGASMRLGQRLCLHCGKLVVQFGHAHEPGSDASAVVLTKAAEDAGFTARLRGALAAVGEGPVPALNILVGDERLYSKRERESMLRLPLRLFDGLAPSTAAALVGHLDAAGLRAKVVPHTRRRRDPRRLAAGLVTGAFMIAAGTLFAFGMPLLAAPLIAVGFIVGVVVLSLPSRARPSADALMRLRRAPAALPASDPWVARLGALLTASTAVDVREQVGALALAVQNLVDHRMEHRAEHSEIALVTAPIDALVGLVEREVTGLATIDAELAGLDEGEIVRSIARSEARGEADSARQSLRRRLGRMRVLEDGRAAAMHRLLDTAAVMRRSIALGLDVRDPQLEHQRLVAASLAALHSGSALAPGPMSLPEDEPEPEAAPEAAIRGH